MSEVSQQGVSQFRRSCTKSCSVLFCMPLGKLLQAGLWMTQECHRLLDADFTKCSTEVLFVLVIRFWMFRFKVPLQFIWLHTVRCQDNERQNTEVVLLITTLGKPKDLRFILRTVSIFNSGYCLLSVRRQVYFFYTRYKSVNFSVVERTALVSTRYWAVKITHSKFYGIYVIRLYTAEQKCLRVNVSYSVVFFPLVSWVLSKTESTWYSDHYLAYCTSPGWWWVWSSQWNDWQGKPKCSEQTYPSVTLSTTNPT
jgi:hypothetical protein